MICYAILHESSCTCGSCESRKNYNNKIYFSEESAFEAISENYIRSQYDDCGQHTIFEIEYSKSSDGKLIFEFSGYSITLNIMDDNFRLPEGYWIDDEKLIELLCSNSTKQTQY